MEKSFAADRAWVHEHVLGEGGMQLYGCLSQLYEEIAPEEFWPKLRRVAEIYLSAGPERARITQEMVDTQIEALVARDVRYGYAAPFCHEGCCACCHEPVYCTDEEARLLQTFCAERGLVIDGDKLRRQLSFLGLDEEGLHTGESRWNDQPRADQSCVFLDAAKGSCRVWPVRPLVCRAHLAEGSSEFCAPHNGEINARASGIDYIELSYILSVVFTLHRNSIRKTLGGLLLELA